MVRMVSVADREGESAELPPSLRTWIFWELARAAPTRGNFVNWGIIGRNVLERRDLSLSIVESTGSPICSLPSSAAMKRTRRPQVWKFFGQYLRRGLAGMYGRLTAVIFNRLGYKGTPCGRNRLTIDCSNASPEESAGFLGVHMRVCHVPTTADAVEANMLQLPFLPHSEQKTTEFVVHCDVDNQTGMSVIIEPVTYRVATSEIGRTPFQTTYRGIYYFQRSPAARQATPTPSLNHPAPQTPYRVLFWMP